MVLNPGSNSGGAHSSSSESFSPSSRKATLADGSTLVAGVTPAGSGEPSPGVTTAGFGGGPRERRARLSAGMARAITNGSLRDSWSLSRRRMRADIQPQTTITSIFRARTSSSRFWKPEQDECECSPERPRRDQAVRTELVLQPSKRQRTPDGADSDRAEKKAVGLGPPRYLMPGQQRQ